MTWRSRPHLDLCRGAACVACGRLDPAVIPAHRNQGKGTGIKASDATAVPMCPTCHSEYDAGPGTKAAKRAQFDGWLMAWLVSLVESGRLVIAGSKAREPLPARMAQRQRFSEATARPSKVLPRAVA